MRQSAVHFLHLDQLFRHAFIHTTAACVIILGPSAAAQAIAGHVVEAGTGAVIAEARVVVLGSDGATVSTLTADRDGSFVTPVPVGGTYRVRANRVGYETARSRPVHVGAHDTARVTLRLREGLVALNGVTITVRGGGLPVKGRFRVSPEPPLESDRPSVAPGEHTLLVRGKFPTPSFCYRFASAASRTAQEIIVLVEARPNGDVCGPSAGTAYRYDVTVKHLRPGTYNLKVLHAFRGALREAVMPLDTTVTVR